MVICYSIKELNTIGEMVILKECISRIPPQSAQSQQPTNLVTSSINPTSVTTNNNNNNANFQQEFLLFQQQLQQQLGNQIQVDISNYVKAQNQQLNADSGPESPTSTTPDNQQLTSSVAEFFRKAQQNFYAQTSINPTKVRRLSEIEAELIASRRDSC